MGLSILPWTAKEAHDFTYKSYCLEEVFDALIAFSFGT